MSELFVTRKNKRNLRKFQALEALHKRAFGTETISYNRPQIWNLIPERLEPLANLFAFSGSIKKLFAIDYVNIYFSQYFFQ